MKINAVFSILLVLTPLLAMAQGVPDLYNSHTECAFSGPGTATLYTLPDGTGAPFSQAQDELGNVVDATITLTLLEANDYPIVDFPSEDIWLESENFGLVPCMGGTSPNENTDLNGVTHWTHPLQAGGHDQGQCRVFVNGLQIQSPFFQPVSFNSPDINADGIVNLIDLQLFTENFFGDYDFRSDFRRDGVLDLADVAAFAFGLRAECP